MQSGDVGASLDALLGKHDGFLVPTELESGLDEGDQDRKPKLIDSQPQFAARLPDCDGIVLTVVLDQVAGNFIHLEGLLKLFVLVEGVAFRLELLRIAELVREVVCQVLHDRVMDESFL